MKLFQQLLVAPAALGLMATGANAAELNINGVSEYTAADQAHLQQRQRGPAEHPQQRNPKKEGWGEVLTKPLITHRRQFAGMDDIGRQLRGQGAFEPVSMEGVPQHLLKNALVVAGQKHPRPPSLQR